MRLHFSFERAVFWTWRFHSWCASDCPLALFAWLGFVLTVWAVNEENISQEYWMERVLHGKRNDCGS
jgi:hypothetical protein